MGWWARVLVVAFVCLFFGFLLSYLFSGLDTSAAIENLPITTVFVGTVSLVGRMLGALGAVGGAARASIVSPGAAGYTYEATRQLERDISRSWVTHVLGIVLAVPLSMVISSLL